MFGRLVRRCTSTAFSGFARLGGFALATFVVIPAGAQQTVQSVPHVRLLQELRIGSASDPNIGFSSVGDVAVDRDGQIFVFERRDRHIRVYSGSGQLLRTISRAGQGPGEFDRIFGTRIGVVGDTVWALTPDGRCATSIALFSRTGTLLSTSQSNGVRLALHHPEMMAVISPRFLRSDGRFAGYQTCWAGSVDVSVTPLARTDTARVPRILFDAKGAVVDTVGWDLRPPPLAISPQPTITVEGRQHSLPVAARDTPIEVPLPDGRIFVQRSEPQSAAEASFAITFTRLNGDTTWNRVIRYTPVPYLPAVLDVVAQESARQPPGSDTFVGGVRQVRPFANIDNAASTIRRSLSFPQFQLPVNSASPGSDGSLWLRLSETGGATTPHLIIDAQGAPRARVDLPRRARIVWASTTKVLVEELDEFDVPWLIRYGL